MTFLKVEQAARRVLQAGVLASIDMDDDIIAVPCDSPGSVCPDRELVRGLFPPAALLLLPRMASIAALDDAQSVLPHDKSIRQTVKHCANTSSVRPRAGDVVMVSISLSIRRASSSFSRTVRAECVEWPPPDRLAKSSAPLPPPIECKSECLLPPLPAPPPNIPHPPPMTAPTAPAAALPAAPTPAPTPPAMPP